MKTSTLLTALAALACAGPLAVPEAQADPAADYRTMKYGFFVHYVWGGDAYSATINKDGSMPAGLDDLANRFDAEGFARDIQAMGVEYVLFTAWHADMNVLYPSKVMEKWRPGHSAKRDLIGDMIKACKAKGIQVLLYTHPRDGHDFTDADMVRTGWARGEGSNPDFDKWNRAKWNDFINEVYGELVERYGKDILGLYLDEGSGAADSYRVLDYPRLRKTITTKHPNVLMMQNDYGNLYSADIGNKEIFYHNGFDTPDGDQWPSYKIPISVVVGSIFWSAFPEGKSEPAQKSAKVGFNKWIPYTPEAMFRYTVLQAGSNTDGGGTLWAAGPYAGGGWETGVLDRMKRTGALIKPVERSIKNTYPSLSWPTAPGKRIADLSWGVATRSTDDLTEYLHVLKAPSGGSMSLRLPAPADGRKFSSALLLENSKPVSLKQEAEALTITLPEGSSWNPVDTVIALQAAPDSPPRNLALWKGCRASSHNGNPSHPSTATDGKPDTFWACDPQDPSPSMTIDLGAPCGVKRIELEGKFSKGDRLLASESLDFSKSVLLATRNDPPPRNLEIRSAIYGSGNVIVDVAAKLRESISSGSLHVKVGNDLCGRDPVPNVPKQMKVEYVLGGVSKVVVLKEDEWLSLGQPRAWEVDLQGSAKFRFLKVVGGPSGRSMQVADCRVFGAY